MQGGDFARGSYVLNLENGALTYLAGRVSDRADATVTLDRNVVLPRATAFREEVLGGRVTIDGSVGKMIEFNSLFDNFSPDFPVVTPLQELSKAAR